MVDEAQISLSVLDFHHMHHALGSPKPNDDFDKTYRNRYCTKKNSETHLRMLETGCWTQVEKINNGRDVIMAVNAEGKRRLKEHLKS